jgi:exoribonuclease R
MPSEETNRLLEDLDRLTKDVHDLREEESPRFERAVEALDRLAGRPAGRDSRAFEKLVGEILDSSDAEVNRQPRSTSTRFRPDFLARVNNRTILVEAEESPRGFRGIERTIGELMRSLDEYGADEAVIVVPTKIEGADSSAEGTRVKIVDVGRLGSFLDQAATS